MENKQNNIEQMIDKGKKAFNYKMTKKTLFSLIGIGACLLLIIALSIANATFNLDVLTQWGFWVGVLLNIAICIYGMITGQQMGDDLSRNNINGQFRKSLDNYKGSRNKIDDEKKFSSFEDWLENYRKRKIERKTKEYLSNCGIKQFEVLDLDINDLSKLKTSFKKDWSETAFKGKYKDDTTYFLSYTDEQIDVIKQCLTGGIKVSPLPQSFFLDALNQSEKDMWESSANAEKKKSLFLVTSYSYKIFILIACCIMLTGLDPSRNDSSLLDSLVNLASRIFTLCTSVVWGMYIGFEMVKIDISFIDFKETVLSLYNNEFNTGIYVPENLEDKARKLWEEEEKKKVPAEVVTQVPEQPKEVPIMLFNKEE